MSNKSLLVILVLIIGAVGVFGFKSAGSSSGSVASATTGSSTITLTTNPNPLQPGPATFMIDVKDKNGNPVDNATVSFDLNMTTMNMGTQRGNATPQGNGRYSTVGTMSMRGPWRVRTSVKLPSGGMDSTEFTVNVP